MAIERPDDFIQREIRKERVRWTGNEKFDAMVESYEERPNESEFADIYDSKEIAEDIKGIEAVEKMHGKPTKIGLLFEAVSLDSINKRGWLGKNKLARRTSRHDDYMNGNDAVIYKRGESEDKPVFALDFTTEEGERENYQKMARTLKDLESGKMPEIKYHQTEDGKHENLKLPRAVVGVDHQNALALFKDYVDGFKNESMVKIDKHPIQVEFIRQIQRQFILGIESAILGVADELGHKTKGSEDPFITELRGLQRKLEPYETDRLQGSKILKSVTDKLHEMREFFEKKYPEMAQRIYSHLDAIDELEKSLKEKDSEGIQAPEVIGITEKQLQIPRKGDITRLARSA
ncbi:MAG: hypothetical protein V1838_00930 [Patescibacteria group bacterium]